MRNNPLIFLPTLFLILCSFNSAKALTNNGLTTSVVNSSTGDLIISTIPISGKVISGQSVTLNYTIPDGAVSAKLSLYCPEGVSSNGGTINTDLCNSTHSFSTIPENTRTVLTNTKDWPQYVVATLFVNFKSDLANTVQVSTQIVVLPASAVASPEIQSTPPGSIADGQSIAAGQSNPGLASRIVSGISSAITSVINSTTDILFPNSANTPTAILTVEGGHEHNYAVGQTINYSWSATNADSYSFILTSNDPDKCGEGTWTPELPSGSFSQTIYEIDNGCAWNITYQASNSQSGRTASDSVKISVGNIAPYTITDTNNNNSFSGQNSSSQGNSSSGGSNSGSGFSSGSVKPSPSPYRSPSPSPTRSASPTPSVTIKPLPTMTPVISPKFTNSPSPSASISPTPSSTVYVPVISPSNSASPSTGSGQASPSISPTPTPTPSTYTSPTVSPSSSASPSPSSSPVSQSGQNSTATIFDAISAVLKVLLVR